MPLHADLSNWLVVRHSSIAPCAKIVVCNISYVYIYIERERYLWMNGISDFVLSITGDDPPALWRFVSLVPTAQCDAQRRDGDLYGSGVMASTWDKSPW